MSKDDRSSPRPRWARNAETARYLNVSVMTLWRWKRDPELDFPRAAVINDIERNNLDLIDEWMRRRTAPRLIREKDLPRGNRFRKGRAARRAQNETEGDARA
jgi:hypothetical protein